MISFLGYLVGLAQTLAAPIWPLGMLFALYHARKSE